MAKKAKKAKNEKSTQIPRRLTRNQKKAMQKSFHSDDPEDLDTQLKCMGLSTKNIAGDGNCLFRALSDQYYGHDGNHKAIRQEVCQFLKENEEEYKFFVEDDQSFEHHIQCMSQNATYGGNMELAAFAKMKEVNIKVYQPGMIYVINGKEGEDDDTTQVLHIAYHSWEHYSSIRNIDGPYSGPPEINVKKLKESTNQEDEEGGEEEEEEQEGLSSKEKVVLNACPGTNIRKIRRLLLKYKGDPDKVIDTLYDPPKPADTVKKVDDIEDTDKVNSIGGIDKQENTEEKDADQSKDRPVEKDDAIPQDQMTDQHTAPVKEDAILVPADIKEPVADITEPVANVTEPVVDITEPVADITETVVDTTETVANIIKETEKKPKKLSAQARKEQAKKKRKEAKLEKDRAKAASRSKNKQEKEDDLSTTKSESISKVTATMKEMYI